jgi:putative acetyltransferase
LISASLPAADSSVSTNKKLAFTIQRLTDSQIEAAKAVIVHGCLEFFGQPPAEFEDMDRISSVYTDPFGTFLVLLDGERVVGTGAIRRLDEQICELKRMWFLPAYRGQGYGTRMSEALFEFARSAGYKRVRLDTAPVLAAANRLYQRLGFYPIERYNDGPGTIFMEKRL